MKYGNQPERFFAEYNLSINAAKKEGFDTDVISRMTGLSSDEIAGLE